MKLSKTIDKRLKISHDGYILSAQVIFIWKEKKGGDNNASKEKKNSNKAKNSNNKAKNKEKKIVL